MGTVPNPTARFIFVLSLISCYTNAILLPLPSGPYTVASVEHNFVDPVRTDIYDPNHGKRNIMTSIFYPVEKKACLQMKSVPYMSARTAASSDALLASLGIPSNGTFESLKLQTCHSISSKAAQEVANFPVVLFSAGLSGARLQYSLMAQEIASAGYVVVTLDSTYDSALVEFPDGSVVNGLDISYWCTECVPGMCCPTDNVPVLLETNVQDAQFVLSQLSDNSFMRRLIPGIERGLGTDKVVYLGHSFGGATAVRASMLDKRIVGVVNLDGSQFGNISDTNAAVLLFGRSEPSPHNSTDDATWRETWDHLKGWRSEIGLKDSQHRTFQDLPRLAKIGGWPTTDQFQQVFGTMDGERSFEIIMNYVKAFLGFALGGRESDLFDGPNDADPTAAL